MCNELELRLERVNNGKNHTNGVLYISDKMRCFTLEDEKRSKKVWGKTRIPEGRYEITLRDYGGFHERYLKRFGKDFHKGMLWIRDVPNFEYILIHIGNDDEDTAGCPLVGSTTNSPSNFIGGSVKAYKSIYPDIRDILLDGGVVWISVIEKNK